MFLQTVLADSKSQALETLRINTHLCIGTKVEYQHCLKKKFKECIQSNIKRYEKDLNCPSLLKGLKISQWSKKLKKRKYNWKNTCNSVADEFAYCLSKEISPCMGDMLKRFNNLYCHRPTRKRIYDLIQSRVMSNKLKIESTRLKNSFK
jgi:hypothetical protein